jgi:SlyX protein
MEHPNPAEHRTEQRLTDLEIKASFTEDLLDQLNAVIVRQQDQIDRLEREIERLRQQPTEPQPGGFRSLRDELPPHY